MLNLLPEVALRRLRNLHDGNDVLDGLGRLRHLLGELRDRSGLAEVQRVELPYMVI